MTNLQPKNIAITGASSGIGRALALEYACEDTFLQVCARRKTQLESLVQDCKERGAKCEYSVFDIRDTDKAQGWINQIDSKCPIDLIIINAGIFSGNDKHGNLENTEQALSVLQTNLASAIAVAATIAKRMRGRNSGHIALVSSLAAFYPQADAPAYSASKAGLTAYGEALREFLEPSGVKVSIIHPGHVMTLQTEIHKGRLPFPISAEHAARHIKKSLQAGKRNIDFPWILRMLIRLNALLPWRLRTFFNRPLRFYVDD